MTNANDECFKKLMVNVNELSKSRAWLVRTQAEAPGPGLRNAARSRVTFMC